MQFALMNVFLVPCIKSNTLFCLKARYYEIYSTAILLFFWNKCFERSSYFILSKSFSLLWDLFNRHIIVFFETSVLKEVRILYYLYKNNTAPLLKFQITTIVYYGYTSGVTEWVQVVCVPRPGGNSVLFCPFWKMLFSIESLF